MFFFCSSGIAIGDCANACGVSIAMGYGSIACSTGAVAIGLEACANNPSTIAIGRGAKVILGAGSTEGIALGTSACVTAVEGFAMGVGSRASNGGRNTAIGTTARADATIGSSVSIGPSATVCAVAAYGTAIGASTIIFNQCASAIGILSRACADSATAIGAGVHACRAGVTTTCELETCVAGCGVIVKTPNGSASYRIAVDNSGNLTTTLV